MSSITDALEAEVAAIRWLRGQDASRGHARAEADRHFVRALHLIAPRIRHFTRTYGLLDHAEDAAQACAIALHRAIDLYDPLQSRFTTFVNWQLRGELQALRFRLRADRRASARKVGAVTVSLDAMLADGNADLAALTDAEALARTEALAAETLARRACGTLLDDHYAVVRRRALRQYERRSAPRGREAIKPGTIAPHDIDRIDARIRLERATVTAHLLGEDDLPGDSPLTSEQRRQIARRTLRALTDRARGNPRFDPEALLLEWPTGERRH